MEDYWFKTWLRTHRVVDEFSLQKALARPKALDSLLSAAPPPSIIVRDEPPAITELTGGKGIDLTGELGCRHIDCLSKEVDGLFRHAWHYFDRIVLPDQALSGVTAFQHHHDAETLIQHLASFVSILRLIELSGGERLVRFEPRAPSCLQHFKEHAHEAGIDQAFTNIIPLVREVAGSAEITWTHTNEGGHPHIDFRVDHPWFEHSEWGSLCSLQSDLPEEAEPARAAIATAVVQRYLSGLSADALAARRSQTALGATIPFYKLLLATNSAPSVEEVAFDLALPISPDIPIAWLIEFRANEGDSFERFQAALRTAIAERLAAAASSASPKLAREIQRDVIDPELRRIRDRLAASRALTTLGAATGLGLGTAAATVGLLTPFSANPIGTGLAVGGAITLAANSIKKAVDDHLAVRRDISLSDMYFLWKAHSH